MQATGLNELIDDFRTEARLATPRARRVVETNLAQVSDTAKGLVEVDTGELRDSISYETHETAGGSASGEVGPTAAHGPFVENGTVHMAPRPFMDPALDQQADEFVDDVLNQVSQL